MVRKVNRIKPKWNVKKVDGKSVHKEYCFLECLEKLDNGQPLASLF